MNFLRVFIWRKCRKRTLVDFWKQLCSSCSQNSNLSSSGWAASFISYVIKQNFKSNACASKWFLAPLAWKNHNQLFNQAIPKKKATKDFGRQFNSGEFNLVQNIRVRKQSSSESTSTTEYSKIDLELLYIQVLCSMLISFHVLSLILKVDSSNQYQYK